MQEILQDVEDSAQVVQLGPNSDSRRRAVQDEDLENRETPLMVPETAGA